MPLLFDSDYEHLKEIGQNFAEDEKNRFLIFKDLPLPEGQYVADGAAISFVDVLYIIPPNYNVAGGDMFWTNPMLARADGQPIPSIGNGQAGQDSRMYDDKEYHRWSRHWNHNPWKPKVDDVRTIVDRLTWAFKYPDAKRT